MQAIIVNDFRHNLAQNLAGLKPFAKIAAFAVGDGGHNSDGSLKPPSITQTSLNNQFASKKIAKIELLDDLTLSVTCILENNEANGKIISEIALLDENNAPPISDVI